jgi:TP901 family phage tail tape measure protein
MAKGFNLTAELNLRGPSNIKAVVSDIRRQIGSVSATITPVLDKSNLRSISSEIKKQLGTITGNVNIKLDQTSTKNIVNDVKKALSSISANINIGVSTAAVKSAGKSIKQQLSGLVVPVGVSVSSSSVNQIRSRIRNQLGNLNVSVNVRLNAGINQTLNNYNTNLTRLNNLLVQTATNATAAASSIDALAAAMRSASSIRLQSLNTNLGNIGNNAARTGQAINGATGEIENFGRQAGLAIRRFAAFSTVAGVAYGITSALKNGVSAFIEYDQQLTRISQVTGDAKDKLGDITSTINKLSTSLGVSSTELASTTLTLAQAGLTAKDTERALKALALSALAPSFDDMNQTVEGSIALMRQFNIGSSQLENALGSINAVSAKFAVEASDIITAIQRTGGVFAASSRGVSEGTQALNEFISVFTSIRATTRESAETIATGLRTIFTRIQRADTIEALKEFGVTLTDLEGKFVGPYIAVQRLSEGLGKLDPRDLKFSSIVEELGGFRQIGKVLPLIQQFGTAQEALKVAQEGQGSLAVDAAKGQQALAVQIAKVRQEFLALIRSIGNTDSFQNIVKVGLDLASALIKVADAAKGLVPLLGLFAALRGAQAVTQFAGGFGRGFRGVGPGQRAAEGGPIRHFASGGYVPGFGNGDTVSAKLTPGEFVMSKPAVKAIGVGNLQRLNSGGLTQPVLLSSLTKRSDNGQRIKTFQNQSEKFIENDDRVFANIQKKTFEDYGFQDKDYPKITNRLERNGIKFPIGLKGSSSRGKFDAISGSVMEDLVRQRMGKGAKKYGGANGYSDISNAPIDIIKGKNIYEVKFKSGSTSDNEILGKLIRYRLENTPYRSLGFKENRPNKNSIDTINLGTINLIHGSDMKDVNGYKSDYISWLKKQGKYKLSFGGKIQKFAVGGTAIRNIGYIDGDILNDSSNMDIVRKEMERLKITDVHKYKSHLSSMAAMRRQSGDLGKLSTVYGVAGSGKSTFIQGGARAKEADNAKLRKTNRYPILTEADILRSDSIIDSTSVVGPNQKAFLTQSDRIINLSSRTQESQNVLIENRKSRDLTGVGLFGRKAGATKGASLDSGAGEAYMAAKEVSGIDQKKIVTYAIGPNFSKKRTNQPTVRTPEKTAVFSGNLGPTTAGHVKAVMQGAKKSKIRPEDTVIYVSGNTPVDPFKRDDQTERTAILPQTSSSGPSRVGMAQKVFGAKGFNVSAAPKGNAPGSIPNVFKVGDDSYIVPNPNKKNIAYMGDDKPSTTMDRYRSQGYEPMQIARDGISGTAARAAIMSNDIEAMKKLLTPEGIAYLKPYMATLQKRPKLLDSILARIQENAQKRKGRAGRYSSTLAELSTLPSRVTAKTPTDVANRVKDLRAQRDTDEAILGRRPARMLTKLERLGKSSGGYIRKFVDAGIVTPTTGKPATTQEIIKLLGAEKAGAIGGISATEVYTTLNKRTPTPQQAASKAAIIAEFTKQKAALASKKEASQTRKQNKATAKGLVFGAAGLFGSAFAAQPVIQTIQDSKLKDPNKQHTVSIYSGVYKNQKRASSIDSSFDKAVDTIPMAQAKKEKRAEIIYQKKKVRSVLSGFESGRELALDFDRTLAFGADKILADPKKPRFSEFSDIPKVTEALGKAKLSVLGRQLVSLVGKKPELLKNIRVITARPKATLPLIQTWLSSKGLPITDSQFKGLGGPTVSGSDIAKLKAAELTPGSIFVDDDKRNINAAKQRADEGIDVYRYRGVKKLKENTQSLENIESLKGNLLEAFIRRLGAVGSPKGNGFDFMTGLGRVSQKFEPKLPPNIPTDVKRTLAGPSTIKDNIVTYLKNVKGYSTGGDATDTVPALVSSGEAYVPPELAKNIGYSKLRQMNRADRNGMRSFAGGGISVFKGPGTGTSDSIGPIGLPVGSFIIRAAATKALGLSDGGAIGVQQFSSGGAVQRFFLGGGPRVPARPGAQASLENVRITDGVVTQLNEITEALTQLGVTSSSSAEIIRKGGQISSRAAINAYEADILRLRVSGAPMQTVIEAETRLANMRQQAATQVRAQRQLSGVSGRQLETIDHNAQQNLQAMVQRRQARGGEVDENFMRRAESVSYGRAARTAGLSPTQTAGLSGNDLRQYINTAMGDPRTFEQMNRAFEARRRGELRTQLTAEGRFGGDRNRILQEARRLAKQEADTRRATLNETRGSGGPGSGGRMSGQGMMGAAFGVQMIGSLIAQNINAESSSSNAQLSAGLQGGTNMLATGAMIGGGVKDMLPGLGKLAGSLGVAAVAAAAVGQAFIDAKNAALAFEKKMIQNKLNSALEETALEFVKLEKDIKDINIQRTITSKLAEAANMAKASMDINSKMAKTFWVNMLDSFGSNEKEGISSQSAAADRADILDKKGIGAYFASTGFGQVMGNQGGLLQGIQDLIAGKKASEMTGNIQAEQTRSSYVQDLIPGRAEESAKQFTPVAENINKLITNKAKGGANISDLITEFKGAGTDVNQFAVSLAMADKSVNAQIQSINNNIDLTADEKKARQDLVIGMHAEAAIRKQAAIAEREAAMKSLENSTSNFARSLERMFQNMEQSINKTNFGLEQMSRDLDLASSSLKGEAKIGSGSLNSMNVLQNPNAYSGAENNSARSQAASMFSGSTNVMKGLLSIGSNLESSILSTINNTIRKNPESNNEKMGFAIQKAVQEQLDSLQLPPDISSKLSGEVSKALEDMRKSGDDKVDFTQLVEKIPQLSKVIESSKRAQEVALKALENWQNALNNYSTRMNELADLQIDTNEKLRKSTQILTDGQLELAKTLGKTIDVSDVRRNVEATTAQQTGGPTRPQDIANQILGLDNTRKAQEGSSDIARQRGPQGADDFVRMQNNLRNTNVALRENYDALKNLAENTDIASTALNKIQEAQQKNEGKVGFIEKLVTSTPEEFNSLNAAFGRLQNNIRGQVNTIQNSQSAQKAYAEALNNGASGFEAMKAAQVAFANDRKETLSALKDVMPFLGDNKQANNIKANVLESMLQESGQGVSPVFQQILNTLRNPQADPETQAAMQQYQQAINTQSDANKQLAMLNNNLASQIANKSAEALAEALTKSKVTFENKELSDIAANVKAIENKLGDKPVPAAGKASGGIIYAAAGMNVDFAPKGTDTVPAMLTPGEFVVNRAATQANLPLLQSINSNKFSSGGKVSYYADGGYVSDFMKTTSRDSDNFNLTQDSYLDLNKNNKLIDNASEKALAGPQIFTRLQRNGLNKTPKNTFGFIDFKTDNIWDNSGEIVAGVTAPIRVTDRFDGGTTAKYTALDKSSKDLAEFKPILTDKLLVGRENLEVSKVSKIEAANYSTKLRAKYPTLSLDKLNLGNELDSIGDFPSSVEPSTLTHSEYNPNGKIRHRAGLYFGSPPPVPSVDFNNAPMNKIWQSSTYFGMGHVDAVSASEPSYDIGDYAGKKFGPSSAIKYNILYYPGISSNSPDSKYLKNRSQIDSLIEKHNENKNIIAQALDFDDTRVKFDQSVNGSYDKLMQSFSALYNGTSSHEDLTGEVDLLKTFAPLGKPRTLFVFPNTPYINSTLQDTVESLNLDQAKANGVQFAIDKKDPGLKNKELTQLYNLFDVTSTVAGGAPKHFPWMMNIDLDSLGKNFEEKAKEDVVNKMKNGPIKKQSLGFKMDKLSIPVGGKNLDLNYGVEYTKYSAPLWDEKTRSFSKDPARQLKDIFIPEPNKSPLDIFQQLEIDKKRIYNSSEFTPGDLLNKVQAIPLLDQYYNALINNDQTKQDNLSKQIKANDIISFSNALGLASNAPDAMNSLIFNDVIPRGANLEVGDWLINAIKDLSSATKNTATRAAKSIDNPNQLADIIGGNPGEIKDTVQKLAKGALGVFGRRKIPGFGSGWAFRYLRGVPGFGARPLKDDDMGKQAAAYASNVFNEAGAYASRLFYMARSPQQYNSIKEAYGLLAGATSAFGGIAGGNTRFIKTLLDNGDMESLFRSLGASANFQKAASRELSSDFKATLGQSLKGSKIRTIGADGSLTYEDFTNQVPKTYAELVDLGLNPYNEFTNIDTRRNIISKLRTDISQGKDSLGMPFYDPQTASYIDNALGSLLTWYSGGIVGWPGQDYFYDKNLPEKDRTDAVIQAIKSGRADQVRDNANLANSQLGVSAKYGQLPSAEWFEARQMAEPQMRANGGMIYAANGQMVNFQPRGTDTVPAMLTPGEFVINREATQKNLPLLKAINNGNHYSTGGIVNYLARGGLTVKKDFMPMDRAKYFNGYDTNKDGVLDDKEYTAKGTIFDYLDFRGNKDGKISVQELDSYNAAYDHHIQEYLSAAAKTKYAKLDPQKQKLGTSSLEFIQTYEAANKIKYGDRKISRNTLEEQFYSGDPNYPFTQGTIDREALIQKQTLGFKPMNWDWKAFGYGIASKAIPGLLSLGLGGLGFIAGNIAGPVVGVGGAVAGGLAGDQLGQYLNQEIYKMLPSSMKTDIEEKIKKNPEAYAAGQWTGFAAEIAGGSVADNAISKAVATITTKKLSKQVVAEAIKSGDSSLTRLMAVGSDVIPPENAVAKFADDLGSQAGSNSRKVVGGRRSIRQKIGDAVEDYNRRRTARSVAPAALERLAEIQSKFNSNIGDAYNIAIKRKYDSLAVGDVASALQTLGDVRSKAAQFHFDDLLKSSPDYIDPALLTKLTDNSPLYIAAQAQTKETFARLGIDVSGDFSKLDANKMFDDYFNKEYDILNATPSNPAAAAKRQQILDDVAHQYGIKPDDLAQIRKQLDDVVVKPKRGRFASINGLTQTAFVVRDILAARQSQRSIPAARPLQRPDEKQAKPQMPKSENPVTEFSAQEGSDGSKEPFSAIMIPAANNSKLDYYDELTYKEYLASLISSGKSPEQPIKNKFITPAFYTNDKTDSRNNIRVTAYDTRRPKNLLGDEKQINEGASDQLEITRLAGSIYGETNNAFKELSDYNQLKLIESPDEATQQTSKKTLGIMQTSYGAAITSLTELSKLINLSKTGNRSIMIGEKQDILVNIDDMVGKLQTLKTNYYSEVLAKGEPLTKINDSILDQFDKPFIRTNAEGKEVSPPEGGYSGKQVREARMDSDQKVRGMSGIETQYQNSYKYYRRILGEYNYHQNIGKGDKYAKGQKTTSSVSYKGQNSPRRMYTGGIVYASEGTLVNFQPRGTDTIPAMLTPGEFVVNAKATKANLSLLKSINSGGTKQYATGGVVYLAEGGRAFDNVLSQIQIDLSDIVGAQYNPAYADKIKQNIKDRESKGVRRVEKTIKNKETGKYETVGEEVKTDEKIKKEKEARDTANKQKIEEYEKFDKQRQTYLNEIIQNKPRQEQAIELADNIREKLRIMKTEFIAQIEEKVKNEAQKLGISLSELFETNTMAKAEWDFIKGKDVEPIGDIETFVKDIKNIISSHSIIKGMGGDSVNIKSISAENINTPNGRRLYYTEVKAKEIKQKNDSGVDGILPDDYRYFVIGNTEKVEGPLSLKPKQMSTGGIVYASNGMLIPYEPKGTDTVPAMLTPGEFVVNRSATQANLPLLKAINNGQTKAYSKGGVVYLAAGGETAQRDKALSQSPAGQLILTIKQQAESNKTLFEALDSSAFSNISSGDLEKKYNDVWSKLDADARYNAAKTQFTQDKKRVDYLTGVYSNASSAYATLKGNQLAVNTKIGDINILQLLKGQEAAMSEAKAIHEAWVSLAQKYPEFRADIGQGGTQAAGTGAVAGTPPTPEKGADKPPEKEPVNKRYGGMVYAAAGGNILPFTPISRGTDTVPAMLTPGEFVVNRTSTQRNLPLLQAINNNRYANGGQVGKVNYLYRGGQPTDETGGGGGVSTGGGSASPNTDGLSQFTATFQSFIDQLKNINPVINLKGEHNVNVNFNGAQYLALMDESIRKIVLSEVNAAMGDLHRDTEGAVGKRR